MSLAHLLPAGSSAVPPAVRELDIRKVVGEIRELQQGLDGEWSEIGWVNDLGEGIVRHLVKKGHFDQDTGKYVVEEYAHWEAWLHTRCRDFAGLVRRTIIAPLLYTDAEAAQKDECERRLHALLRDALIQSPVVSEKVAA